MGTSSVVVAPLTTSFLLGEGVILNDGVHIGKENGNK